MRKKIEKILFKKRKKKIYKWNKFKEIKDREIDNNNILLRKFKIVNEFKIKW